ncbi:MULTISPECIES: helicase associated domain-containing protein [Streptomyces]|uniref:helicase associated domain-containing protein n=1 Tax=Streptomyces TaxID=1883 RepID=UPI000B9E3FEA|nr:helicase associated domain-containing protein [Streptomyces kasugaensis]
MANLRRKSGLGKGPERAAERAAQLTAIYPDWNCPWPLDWQRHYRILADLAEDEPNGTLPDIAPGLLYNGDDLGRWAQQQSRNWSELCEEQQRLSALGMKPAERPAPTPAAKGAGKTAGKASAAFQRGMAALTQYTAREGAGKPLSRGHIELVVIDGQKHEPKLGTWYANQTQRRDKLTPEQRTALTELGVEWA